MRNSITSSSDADCASQSKSSSLLLPVTIKEVHEVDDDEDEPPSFTVASVTPSVPPPIVGNKLSSASTVPLLSQQNRGSPASVRSTALELTARPARLDSPLLQQRSGTPVCIIAELGRSPTVGSGMNQQFNRTDSTRSRFRYGVSRKIRRRAVFKNGDCNVLQSRISRRRVRFLQDIFTTLVDTQWRWTLLVFAASFILSWLCFASIWWLIAFTHGDLEPQHLPPNQEDANWTPCINEIYSFASCFLFSIETQHTIGYGSRSTTEECPEAIFIMCMQSITGVMIQAFMVGIVFAKMTRPKHRTQTLLFSRNAVICQRDGQLCFMFRVGDMRKSHIIGANIRAQLIRSRTTKEGEVLNQFQSELEVGADGCSNDLFFIWPLTIVHKINEDSPLYNFSAADLLQERFEIVVILEGTIESTGQTTQARSSYLATEILWGHRFEPVVSYNKERQGYEVDYSNFDHTLQVDTPLCSGRDLAEFYRAQDEFRPLGGVVQLDGNLKFEEDENNKCTLILQDPPSHRKSVVDVGEKATDAVDCPTDRIVIDENMLARSEESII